MDSFISQVGISIKVTLSKINEKVMAKCFGLMDHFIRVIGRKEYKMAKGKFILLVDKLSVEFFKIVYLFKSLLQFTRSRWKYHQWAFKIFLAPIHNLGSKQKQELFLSLKILLLRENLIKFKKDQRKKVLLKIIFILKLQIKRIALSHRIGIQVHMEQQVSLISQAHRRVLLMEQINIITLQLISMATVMDTMVGIANALKDLKIFD